jgi:hypothetical protein
MAVIQATQMSWRGGLWSKVRQAKSLRPYLKNNKSKKASGMAGEQKVLHSNSRTTEREREREREREFLEL